MNAARRRRALLPALALAALAAGCQIDAADLARWKEVQEGQERLSGYLASAERPLELRVRAARYLFEVGAPGQIVHVLKSAPAADRKAVLEPLLLWLGGRFTSELPDEPPRAKDLLYALLPLTDGLATDVLDTAVQALMTWGVPLLDAKPAPPGRPVEQVIVATGLKHPSLVSKHLAESMRQAQTPAQLLHLTRVADAVGAVPGRLHVAGVLMERLRQALPQPDPALLEAAAINGNETLMRFLLDAGRDPEVPPMTRAQAIDLAVGRLGPAAVPGLESILRSEDPVSHNALRIPALVQLHALRGPAGLRETLEALPSETGWPEEGDDMRRAVERFCDEALAPQKARNRKGLQEVLVSESPVARVFAAHCIRRLYPDEAGEMLEPLRQDKTPLRGFGRDPPPTLGDLARGRFE